MLEDHPEYARLLGLIVSHWNTVEIEMIIWYAFVSGMPSDGLFPILYAIPTTRARFKAMETVLHSMILGGRTSLTRAQCDSIFETAYRLLVKRNDLAHTVFSTDPGTIDRAPAIINARIIMSGAEGVVTESKLNEMQNTFDQMRRLGAQLSKSIRQLASPAK